VVAVFAEGENKIIGKPVGGGEGCEVPYRPPAIFLFLGSPLANIVTSLLEALPWVVIHFGLL
jgi:hypothetical protein